MEKFDALVGFSVNPEIAVQMQQGRQVAGKRPVEIEIALSGTSYDVAWALQQAGRRPFLLGAVGREDAFNGWIEHQLSRAGLPHHLLEIRRQTALAIVEQATGLHWSYKTSLEPTTGSTLSSLLAGVDVRQAVRVVTGLQADENEVALAKAILGELGNIRVLNPRESLVRDWNKFQPLLERTDWLVLNRHEARAFHPRYESTGPADFLQFGPSVVVLTRDTDGAEIITRDGFSLHVPAYSFGEVVHETGAGDCLLGYFIAGRLNGWSWEKSLRMAVIAAGIKVTRRGTAASPMLDEVQRCYDNIHGPAVLS